MLLGPTIMIVSIDKIPKMFGQKTKIWHFLCGITLWMIWIERNDRVFDQEQWHDSKVKHIIWGDLIMYAKVLWTRVIKYVKTSVFLLEANLKSFRLNLE